MSFRTWILRAIGTRRVTAHRISAVCVVASLASLSAAQDMREDPTPSVPGNYRFFEPVTWDSPEGTGGPFYSAIGDIGGYDEEDLDTYVAPDGRPDVVATVNTNQKLILVWRNRCDWGTGQPTTDGMTDADVYDLSEFDDSCGEEEEPPCGRVLYGVALADFDADGFLDLVASLQRNGLDNEPLLVILYNDGVGRFTAGADVISIPEPYDPPSGAANDIYGLTAYDFYEEEGVNRQDILVAGRAWDEEPDCGEFDAFGYPTVWFVKQTSLGNFSIEPIPFTISGAEGCVWTAMDVAQAKLKVGGGIPTARRDAVVAMTGTATPQGEEPDSVEEWVGTLTHNSSTAFDVVASPGIDAQSIAAGRLRSSVSYDDAVSGRTYSALYSNQTHRYFNNGSGVLTRQTTFTAPGGTMPIGLSVGTIDENGSSDVGVALNDGGPPWWGGNGCVAIHYGQTGSTWNGTFSTTRRYNVDLDSEDQNPSFVRFVDMDGDGRRDVVTTCTGSWRLSVLINRGTNVLSNPPCDGVNDFGRGRGDECPSEIEDDVACEEVTGEQWDSTFGPFDY